MTVYATNIPDIAAFDHYKYDGGPGELPASGVDFNYPAGTVEGDPIILVMSFGTGFFPPTIKKRTSGAVINSFTSNRANGSSSQWWQWVAGTEPGFNVRFFNNFTLAYISSPCVIWAIRMDGSTNPPEDLTFAGPRYQYWSSDVTFQGNDNITFPSTDFVFNPTVIYAEDTPLFEDVPGGTNDVNAFWFQSMVLDTDFGGDFSNGGADPYPAPAPYGDHVPLPATPSGWTLLDYDTYEFGASVDTVAIYWRQETGNNIQFPSTTVAVPYHLGLGGALWFDDYDYTVPESEGGDQGFDEWWDITTRTPAETLAGSNPATVPQLNDGDPNADVGSAGNYFGWNGTAWGPLDTLDGGTP